jgi:hypothetical protein
LLLSALHRKRDRKESPKRRRGGEEGFDEKAERNRQRRRDTDEGNSTITNHPEVVFLPRAQHR